MVAGSPVVTRSRASRVRVPAAAARPPAPSSKLLRLAFSLLNLVHRTWPKLMRENKILITYLFSRLIWVEMVLKGVIGSVV